MLMDEPFTERGLLWGLLGSLILHAVFLNLLRSSRLAFAPPAERSPIEVELAPPLVRPQAAVALPRESLTAAKESSEKLAEVEPNLTLPERQIVAPPDAGEEVSPRKTRLLSDRDNQVREEMVLRADRYMDAARSAPPSEQKEGTERRGGKIAVGQSRVGESSSKKPQAVDPQVAHLPKIDQLLPTLGDVAVAPGPPPTPSGGEAAGGGSARRLLMDSGGPTFSLRPGTADFLPGIREGNVTLLNTKAERFAPFVRRVATRVFQHLDIRLRQAARAGNASAGREYAVVEAVMDREGRLVQARVVERQSTSTFGADRILLSTTTPETFFDANPPAGAEGSDGYIHFLLLIDLDIVTVPDPRTGRVAVGYRGIAGVGLDALADRRR